LFFFILNSITMLCSSFDLYHRSLLLYLCSTSDHLHFLSLNLQLLKRKHQKPLFEALQKIKEGKSYINSRSLYSYIGIRLASCRLMFYNLEVD
jgi:hypothetical protein